MQRGILAPSIAKAPGNEGTPKSQGFGSNLTPWGVQLEIGNEGDYLKPLLSIFPPRDRKRMPRVRSSGLAVVGEDARSPCCSGLFGPFQWGGRNASCAKSFVGDVSFALMILALESRRNFVEASGPSLVLVCRRVFFRRTLVESCNWNGPGILFSLCKRSIRGPPGSA